MATEPIQIPEGLTIEDVHRNIARWCDQEGWLFGVPLPAMGANTGRKLVVAKGTPRKEFIEEYQREQEKVEDVNEYELAGSWYPKQESLFIIKENGKPVLCRENAVRKRLQMLFHSVTTRIGIVSARAEGRAMMTLADHLSEYQVESYVLNGCFAETSPRSGVTYIFRKGLPTLAIKKREESNDTKFLAALCLHPIAYYEDTFTGAMAPSDEMLAHLLLMRGDEHRFWRKANQHPMWDPRSGV
jgi:hypothetical protein